MAAIGEPVRKVTVIPEHNPITPGEPVPTEPLPAPAEPEKEPA